MNERIRELAEQCQHRYSEHNIDLEKFAELIVKECAKVLEVQGATTGREEYNYGASLLEEHFGIEE